MADRPPTTKYHILRDEEKRALARREAVRLVREDKLSKAAAARLYGISRETLYQWLRLAEAHGGAVPLKPEGPKPLLSPAQKDALAALIDAGPRAAGLAFDAWTIPRIATLIERHFGAVYKSTGHLSEMLREMGFSAQRPETKARERDAQKIEAWRRDVLPELEKKSRRGGHDPRR